MSEGPREYDLNFDAANELEEQASRAKRILERLAAHLAATEPHRDPQLNDIVDRAHVRRAAELVFGSIGPAAFQKGSRSHCVFVSFSHADEPFVAELTAKLAEAHITYFKADRDIQPATDWGEAIWDAIRDCGVFLPILTPRFIRSRWCDLEGGAAWASKKTVLPVLRYVERSDVPVPFNRFQSVVVENSEQLDGLIAKLREMCEG